MDTNTGEFVGPDRAEAWMERLGVGEIVKIKGEELEVVKIGRSEVTLELCSLEDRSATLEEALRKTKTPLFEPSSKKQARSSFPKAR